jgi:hypothetical protein
MCLGITKAKSSQDPISSNKKLVPVVHTCYPNYSESVSRRIAVQVTPKDKKERTYSKNKSKND